MRRAIEAVLALVIAALVLPNPAVAYLPAAAGPTGEEVQRSNQAFDEATWFALPISQSMPRPLVARQAALTSADWIEALVDCSFDVPNVNSMSAGPEGVVFEPTSAGFDDSAQLKLYECAVAHPLTGGDLGGDEVLAPAQVEYLYDYYVRWVVPCLARNGYQFATVPDRASFIETYGAWSPYSVLKTPDGTDVQTDRLMNLATATCGIDRPGI